MEKLRKNKKGFTLVEIIVVLLILAILAAAAIPTMLGFVNQAKKNTQIGNARAAYVALQMIATKEAGSEQASTLGSTFTIGAAGTGTGTAAELNEYLGPDMTGAVISDIVVSNGKITSFTFTNGGFVVSFVPGAQQIEAEKAAA